jgi:hypothetical protein
MRGVVFKGNREAEIREFPDPHAGPGEAVVKIRASGLCSTDLHRYILDQAVEAFRMFDGAKYLQKFFCIPEPLVRLLDRFGVSSRQ